MKLRKIFSLVFILFLVFALVACNKNTDDNKPVDNDEPVLVNYAEYVKTNKDAKVIVKAYVQAKDVFKADEVDASKGKASLYLADADGGYFAYEVSMTKAEYDALEVGAFVEVTGVKAEWKGEVELSSATLKTLEGEKKTFDAIDLTDKMDDAEKNMNRLVKINGLTVVGHGSEGLPFTYTWGGGGERGSDLYVDLALNGKIYTFVVETDLKDENTDVYKAVEALKLGETVDIEGFAYWYEGLQIQLTKVTGKNDVASYAEFVQAEKNTILTIAGFVSDMQKYAETYKNTTIYLRTSEGAYFVYRLPLSQEEYDTIKVGSLLKVKGPKSEWKGEVELSLDGTTLTGKLFEVFDRNVTFGAVDMTDDVASATNYMNQLVTIKGCEVVGRGDENEPFTYTWAGGGERGADLYFSVKIGSETFEFVVESDLFNEETDVYKAVEALQVGQLIDITGYDYFYNNTLQLQVKEVVLSK